MREEKREILKQLEKLCKEHNITLDGLHKRLVTYPNLTEQLLKLPEEISEGIIINQGTIQNKLPLWMANIRENFEMIKEGNDVKLILAETKDIPALIIGAGPSLYRKKHLELIAEKGFQGKIFASDRVLINCLKQGIIPDYVVFLDASEKFLKFIDHDIVDKYAKELTGVFNITVHPSVVKRWKGKIYWYQTYMDETFVPNVSHIIQLLTRKTALASGGQCCSLAWIIAILKKCNPVVLIGIDLSFPSDIPVEQTDTYAYYLNDVFNGDKEKALGMFNGRYHHTFFNTDCYLDAVFQTYTDISMEQFKTAKKQGIRVINCTGGGTIEGEGVECMWFEDYLDLQRK